MKPAITVAGFNCLIVTALRNTGAGALLRRPNVAAVLPKGAGAWYAAKQVSVGTGNGMVDELRTRKTHQRKAVESGILKRVHNTVHFLVKLHTHCQKQR